MSLDILLRGQEYRCCPIHNPARITCGVNVADLINLWVMLERDLVYRFTMKTCGHGTKSGESGFKQCQSIQRGIRAWILIVF